MSNETVTEYRAVGCTPSGDGGAWRRIGAWRRAVAAAYRDAGYMTSTHVIIEQRKCTYGPITVHRGGKDARVG